MSYSRLPRRGYMIIQSIIGRIKGDTRSLDWLRKEVISGL